MPSFRAGKITRVDAWLESLGLWLGSFEQSWFYSDSHNDLPLLEQVTNPVAVDADATLAQCRRPTRLASHQPARLKAPDGRYQQQGTIRVYSAPCKR
jgi:phosphoserine phosphatase